MHQATHKEHKIYNKVKVWLSYVLIEESWRSYLPFLDQIEKKKTTYFSSRWLHFFIKLPSFSSNDGLKKVLMEMCYDFDKKLSKHNSVQILYGFDPNLWFKYSKSNLQSDCEFIQLCIRLDQWRSNLFLRIWHTHPW